MRPTSVSTLAKKATGKPYIDSESTPTNAPGEYWGSYSKVKAYYNYINSGIYSEQMKQYSPMDSQVQTGSSIASSRAFAE